MKKIILFIMIVVLVSCSKQSEPADKSMEKLPSLKISVLKTGAIQADGKEISIHDLDNMFAELKKVGGTVWYYREDGKTDPPPQAMEVIKLITKYELPITLSSKPDFSDYIGEDGQSLPRKK